jgi:hypothetical protein
VAVGGEWDRIVQVLKKYPCEKVIFTTSSLEETKKEAAELKKLVSTIIDAEIVQISYSNLGDTIQQLKKIIEKNEGKYEKIYANISGGTRIVSVALVLLSQYYPIQVLYAVPKEHTPNGLYKTKGVRKIMELPTIRLQNVTQLKESEEKVMGFLGNKPVSFSRLMKDYAKSANIKLDDLTMRDLKARFSYTLKNLKNKNLIKTEMRERQLYITLSETGDFFMKLKSRKD